MLFVIIYSNRAVNVQIVNNANLKISILLQDSQVLHIAKVFNTSNIKRYFEIGNFPRYILIGSSTYALNHI